MEELLKKLCEVDAEHFSYPGSPCDYIWWQVGKRGFDIRFAASFNKPISWELAGWCLQDMKRDIEIRFCGDSWLIYDREADDKPYEHPTLGECVLQLYVYVKESKQEVQKEQQ